MWSLSRRSDRTCRRHPSAHSTVDHPLYFLEGGRFTIDDVHYVAEGDKLVPAAATPVKDAAFGYRNSDLKAWVAEKSGGRLPVSRLPDLAGMSSSGGPEQVAQKLLQLSNGAHAIVNCVTLRDMQVFVSGLLRRKPGQTFSLSHRSLFCVDAFLLANPPALERR